MKPFREYTGVKVPLWYESALDTVLGLIGKTASAAGNSWTRISCFKCVRVTMGCAMVAVGAFCTLGGSWCTLGGVWLTLGGSTSVT